MAVKKDTTLRMFFLKYLVGFSISVLLILIANILGFYTALQTGFILPANYSEKALEAAKAELMASEPFNPQSIPHTVTYVLLDREGRFVEGDMRDNHRKVVLDSFAENLALPRKNYISLVRDDHTTLVVRYDITPHFASPALHRLLPIPEVLAMAMVVLSIVVLALFTAYRFGTGLNEEILPLIEATKAIEEKNLDFEVSTSRLHELKEALAALEALRSNLAASLQKQWQMENLQKKQMAAVAHDIKTPLTIIKGNAQLLLETVNNREDKSLLCAMEDSAEKIEHYSDVLMQVAKSGEKAAGSMATFHLNTFLDAVLRCGEELCRVKGRVLIVDQKNLPETFTGDLEAIEGALLNILDNAIQYGSMNSRIDFFIRGLDTGALQFTIADRGPGFTAEALKMATTEFYTEQTARSGKHYGLGLYLAKICAEKHGGTLTVANRQDGGGGVVTFVVRNLQKDV
ncbi:MAG: HAMP domain-containing histidine kinase [Eubacteriaceae bacterium]|jgi:signal transduction histidine kinase|nr:HAMP domain-containing histidine kinase [Eubacteriaceae bacterium]